MKGNWCVYSCVAQVCPNTASLRHLDRTGGVSRPPTHPHTPLFGSLRVGTQARAALLSLFVCTRLFTNTQWGLCLTGMPQQWEIFRGGAEPDAGQGDRQGRGQRPARLQLLIKPLKLWGSHDFQNIPGMIQNFGKYRVCEPGFMQLLSWDFRFPNACAPGLPAPHDLK